MAGLLKDSRELATLAVPLAVTQLAQVALTTTDTVMMGLLGAQALAAGGLALVLFNQLRTMGVGMLTAVGNQIAAADVTDDTRDVRELVRASFALATVGGVIGAVIMVALGYTLPWLGQDQAVVDTLLPVLFALAPGLVPCLWFQALRQYTVGLRKPQALLRITVASIAVNAALNWALIHGLWIFPELGMAGIGVSTSTVYLLSFFALYAAVRRDVTLNAALTLQAWRARPDLLRRLVKLGLPIAATYGSEAGFFSVVALLIGSFGAAALAAHTAVNQLIYLTFQVAVGLSHAASISVSRDTADGNTAGAARVGRTALINGAAVATILGFAYVAVPDLVLRPFFDPTVGADRAALAIASQLLVVAALLQYVDYAQNIGVGLLRGINDTTGGFRMTLIGYWIVGLPAAWLLGRLAALGPVGVWIGLLTGLAVTAALLLTRFARRLAALANRPDPPTRSQRW